MKIIGDYVSLVLTDDKTGYVKKATVLNEDNMEMNDVEKEVYLQSKRVLDLYSHIIEVYRRDRIELDDLCSKELSQQPAKNRGAEDLTNCVHNLNIVVYEDSDIEVTLSTKVIDVKAKLYVLYLSYNCSESIKTRHIKLIESAIERRARVMKRKLSLKMYSI